MTISQGHLKVSGHANMKNVARMSTIVFFTKIAFEKLIKA